MKEILTKTFTNGFVSVLMTDDGKKIETTSTCLPLSTEIRNTNKTNNEVDINEFSPENWKEKWMVGVSTQVSCPIGCKFCNVTKLTDTQGWRNLTADEIFEQVEYAVKKTKEINGDEFDPKDSKLFRVLFTRMGEPALNIDNVIDAVIMIKNSYPKARIQISTIGINKSVELIRRLIVLEKAFGNDWLEVQFSIHSTDNEYRRWLQNKSVMSNLFVGKLAAEWYDAFPNRPWKATLNFALTKSTPFDPKMLGDDFDPKKVFVKISPLNENPVSDESNLKTLFKYQNSI